MVGGDCSAGNLTNGYLDNVAEYCASLPTYVNSLVGTATNKAAWTVMMYIVADNELECYAVDGLAHLMESQVSANTRVNVVVLMDRGGRVCDHPYIPEWTGAREFQIDWQGTSLIELTLPYAVENGESYPILDMSMKQYLSDFIARNVERFPAERYFLMLEDHGMGWLGFGQDEHPGNREDVWPGSGTVKAPHMILEDIGGGLQDGLRRANVEKLDLLGLETCLMQHYSVVANLKDYARYIMGSQDSMPGSGFVDEALEAAVNNPDIDAPTLAQYYESQFFQYRTAETPLTLSTVDTGRFVTFNAMFEQLLMNMWLFLDEIQEDDFELNNCWGTAPQLALLQSLYMVRGTDRDSAHMKAMESGNGVQGEQEVLPPGSVIDLGIWLRTLKS
eukprot:gene7381-8793_t